MEDLDWLREEINEIDESLVKLFKKRMEVVSKVAHHKIENHMEVLDKSREKEIINKHLKNIEDKSLQNNLKEFLEDLMSISRKTQKEILSKASYSCKVKKDNEFKVGFQGVPASFSHQALNEYFGNEVKTEHFQNFKDVFEAVQKGDIKYGVLPIENSSTGGISEVYDLMREYGFYIVGEKCVKVDHNLMGIKAAEICDINEVYSHTQGFLQCKEFFDNHSSWTLIPYFNTAKSAEYVSKENLKNKVCVASKKAAEVYGLKILKENINYNSNNYTRFIIIGREEECNCDCDKISVVMAISHKAGALYSVLKYFADNNLNMMKIESRPIVDKSWQYFFYIDFQGSILSEDTKNALKAIEEESLYFKFLGNYKGEVN
jgi:chorismate mutase/prephenate dehydratase